ncbi:GTPase Era [Candidatus Synechococcus calcipolaris G9]|uniref:GTPase Era n=1 Tax=Candidatus Synechococcus calcipolaris G9 TaxID=1497997 RepID=A0ABT6EXK1_9SYNE|nr:GTPase Era [Candidatus Synechococcus calcipolaris]MDG2990540.1 GTPase Era [Candidatus Synechococcus calcipolaris G9]
MTLIPVAAPDFRSGFVALVGRPNVGKSTLFNQLIGQKVAITSPVVQTTRNRLRGILTTETAQFIFVDTPGIHKPHHALGQVLVSNAKLAINAVDVVVLVVDGSQPAGGGDRYVADLLKQTQTPVFLGLNKADLIDDDEAHVRRLAESYQALGDWPLLFFSALMGEGVLPLQEQIQAHLPPGPYYYPADAITDQPERFIMAELIREQILHLTHEEVPHSVAVTIDQIQEEEKLTRVLATICVERNSQKRIVIGKGGQMLKAIGSEARQQMQKLINGHVYLELFVKVRPKWRQSRLRLAEFGYRVEAD